jgi:hypothetical protein
VDPTSRRKAANEAVFREVNEQIEGLQSQFALATGEPLRLVCECDRLECNAPLTVKVDVYEQARSDSACFFVTIGHEDPEVEEIVDTGSDYLIVRKGPGEPREIAEQTDPRK